MMLNHANTLRKFFCVGSLVGGGWEMGRMCFCIILRGVVIVEGEGGIYKVYVHMEMLLKDVDPTRGIINGIIN